MRKVAKVEVIRKDLDRMEDEIMSDIWKRANLPLNPEIYEQGGFFGIYFRKREELDNEMGRYTDRREHSFFPIREDITPILRHPEDLDPVKTNRNLDIYNLYFQELHTFSREGSDRREYGTCAEVDIVILRGISERVHRGEYVAESKWQSDMTRLLPLISSEDWTGLAEALRDRTREEIVVNRVREKALDHKLDPKYQANFYLNHIIPLTIEVEAEYLRRNKGRASVDRSKSADMDLRIRLQIDRLSKAHLRSNPRLIEDVAVESIKSDNAVISGIISYEDNEEYKRTLANVLKHDEVRASILRASRGGRVT